MLEDFSKIEDLLLESRQPLTAALLEGPVENRDAQSQINQVQPEANPGIAPRKRVAS